MRHRWLHATVLAASVSLAARARAEPVSPQASARVAASPVSPPERSSGAGDPAAGGARRTAAWIVLGSGIASFAAAIAFGAVALAADRSAEFEYGPEFDELTARRDGFQVGAAIAGSLGVGLMVTGGLLLHVDGARPSSATLEARVQF